MLTVCVPHYNFENLNLFESLIQQADSIGIECELLIIDDCSDQEYKQYLTKLKNPYYRIIFLSQNIGRSKIRNLLAAEAKYDLLLYLDADSGLVDADFLKRYITYQQMNPQAAIISGGRIYPHDPPAREYLFHWSYGKMVEINSDSNFHSNNFLIKKSVFEATKFDENLKNYGYEDLIFGLSAKRMGFTLHKINNPVIHLELKNKSRFLRDTKHALENIVLINQMKNDDTMQHIKILSTYLKWKFLTPLLSIGNNYLLSKLEKNILAKDHYQHQVFILFKLYYLHQVISRKGDKNYFL